MCSSDLDLNILKVEIVTRVYPQTSQLCSLGRRSKSAKDCLKVIPRIGGCIGLRIQLDSIRPEFPGLLPLIAVHIHENAHASTAVVELRDYRLQPCGFRIKIPSMVRSNSIRAIRDEGALHRLRLSRQLEKLRKGVPFDVELDVRMVS